MSADYINVEIRARPSTPADRVIRNQKQREHVKQLWIFLACVLFTLTVIRFLRYVVSRLTRNHEERPPSTDRDDKESNKQEPLATSAFYRLRMALASGFRILFFRKSIPIGPGSIASLSELSFILIYIAAMFIWLLVDTRDLWAVMYQDRAAHLASSQLPLIVALAGKNNLISWMTGISHERLNVLHRAAARTNFIFLWMHAITRVVSGLPPQFDFTHNWMRSGAVGLGAFTIATFLSIRPIRHVAFEFFLVTHIVFIFIFLVAGYWHAKAQNMGDYIWPGILVWAFDRFLRVCRLVLNNRFWSRSHAGDALVELLSEDTIRLTLTRRMSWTPGQHAYVILPSVSQMPFEAHPFTIASIPSNANDKGENDVVFLIRGREGFTRRLREHAVTSPGSRVSAFLDGPYGCPPDLSQFTTCVLVAGGSGISYTLPLLLNLVRLSVNNDTSYVRRIVFVWAVRDAAHLQWISKTLVEALAQAPRNLTIDPRIYITGKAYPIPEVPTLSHSTPVDAQSTSSSSEKYISSPDSELPVYSSLKLTHGRPSMKKLLHEEIANAHGPVSVDGA
ncbi:hypothetical protein CVT24_003630 [Panaeolus cyanescens]|uniref:ferric-chelate reductase (NADPH) n=1 Tax=Panaeolus cyanescens TaxID=181874 RepID=A0A409Y7S6_9AGAR|nr:hypothetical protein CVT24_003630 [Panaeolus cyanescens]